MEQEEYKRYLAARFEQEVNYKGHVEQFEN